VTTARQCWAVVNFFVICSYTVNPIRAVFNFCVEKLFFSKKCRAIACRAMAIQAVHPHSFQGLLSRLFDRVQTSQVGSVVWVLFRLFWLMVVNWKKNKIWLKKRLEVFFSETNFGSSRFNFWVLTANFVLLSDDKFQW
jgi:hypothetical protein